MHEQLERPDQLAGSTYKIKTPLSDHALYVTINDIVLNPGTEHELRRPFEIFINSKNMEHFQWIVALTRIISAVFRKGGDVAFLVEELHSVFDPGGGYLKRGGKHVPSLVAEIGTVIEDHLIHDRDGGSRQARRTPAAPHRRDPPRARVRGRRVPGQTRRSARRCSTKAAVMMRRVHDLSQLRGLQVRLITEGRPRVGATLRRPRPDAPAGRAPRHIEQRAPEGTPALGPPSPGDTSVRRETAGLFSPAP